MRITVYVSTVEEVPAARAAAEEAMIEGDELEIIVAMPVARPAERQDARPAAGIQRGTAAGVE